MPKINKETRRPVIDKTGRYSSSNTKECTHPDCVNFNREDDGIYNVPHSTSIGNNQIRYFPRYIRNPAFRYTQNNRHMPYDDRHNYAPYDNYSDNLFY